MAQQPLPGRDPRAERGNGGMYAVVGFLALIALVVGGIVLFNSLSKDKAATNFKMPNVVGQPIEDGSKALTDAGLAVTAVPLEPADPSQPAGAIVRTDPAADADVVRDQAVQVFYNPTTVPFVLDDLKGKTQQEALDYLASKGLVLNSNIVTENDPSVEAGKVIRTDPPAGTQVQQGDTITLVVSGGPNQVSVPPVAGLSEADASATLTTDAYGFQVTVQPEASDTVASGTAIRTDPAAGQLVDKGSAIILYVSSGKAPVKVPPLENLTEAAAREQLTALGLVPDVSYQAVPIGDAKDGKVISQNIASGTDVAAGSTVKLKVGKAPPPPTTSSSTTTTSTTTTTTTPPPTT